MDLKALFEENKKNILILCGIVLIVVIFFIIIGSLKPTDDGKKVTEIVFEENITSVEETKTYPIKYTIYPSSVKNVTLSWSSSNEEVATVDGSGLVTAIRPGIAIIVAKATSGIYQSLTLTVKEDARNTTSVVFDIENFDLKVGTYRRLYTILTPEALTYDSIAWTSSNESVATVSQIGKITALKTGKTIITATLKLQDQTYLSTSSNVTVVKETTLSLASGTSKNLVKDATSPIALTLSDSDVTVKQAVAETSNENIVQVVKRPTFNSENATVNSIIKGMGVGTAEVKYTVETVDGELINYVLKVTVK